MTNPREEGPGPTNSTTSLRRRCDRFLKRWYFWATRRRLIPIIDATRTINCHQNAILRWFDTKTANGLLEGLNSLVLATKAKARGYRTTRNLIAIVYLLVGNLDLGLPA